MNLSTRLDYVTSTRKFTSTPSNRPARTPNSAKRSPLLWTGRVIQFTDLEFPTGKRSVQSQTTRTAPLRAYPPIFHLRAPLVRRRRGPDCVDLQFALAEYVRATRTLDAVRVQQPGKSERERSSENATPLSP